MIKFLIWSNQHGGWWAPGGRGYTLDIGAAGRFTKDLATREVEGAGAYGPHASDGVPDEVMMLAPEHRWDGGPPEPGSVGDIERRLRHAVDVTLFDRLSPAYVEARLEQLLRDAAATDPRWTEEAETAAKKAAIHLTAGYAAGASDVVPSDENIALAVLAALADAGLLTPPQTPDAAQNRGWNSPRPA